MNTKVGDIVSTSDILSLPSNSAVFFTVGVGGGKSHFCKHQLYDAAEIRDTQILYVINRKNPRDQFGKELYFANKKDRITITTYQAIESLILSGEGYDLSPFYYIVLDEYHHFIADTTVDIYTDLVVDLILNASCVRFLLSATPYGTDVYLKEQFSARGIYYTTYILPASYSMMKLQLFYNDDLMDTIANKAIREDVKAIFFSNNIKRLYALYKKYEDRSMFICSEYNANYSQHINEELKNKMISSERLPVQFLFATTCLDIGFNVKDASIKYIVCDLDDIDQIKQCIGRRRVLHQYDTFQVYVKGLSNSYMTSKIKSWEQQISKVQYLMDYGSKAFVQRYRYDRNIRFDSDLICFDVDADGNCNLQPIYLGYLYYLYRIQRYQSIIDSDMNYRQYLLRELGCSTCESIAKTSKINWRYEYLESIQGELLLGHEARVKLYKALGYYKDNKNLIRSLTGLNEALLNDNLPFQIDTVVVRNPLTTGKLTGWKVKSIV